MNAVIIGGGAGGIACAIRLKQNMPDCAVTVLEQLDAPCKKLFATGNGRCNLTNTAAEGFETTKEFFESVGLVLRESREGRMYPYSNQAATVVNTLVQACERLGISIVTEAKAYNAEKTDAGFRTYTSKGVYMSDVLVIATGGKAQKALGSDGSGYALAQCFGHTVTPLSPALVQLSASGKHCRALKGMRAKCRLTIEVNGEAVASDYGELLFADYGISGIVTMNLSGCISDERLKSGQDKAIAVIDFVPEMSLEQLTLHYEKFGTLEGILPAKLCSILSRQANDEPEKIVKYAKNWKLIITGTKGYDFAQITKGGVSKDELTGDNESKLAGGLYIIGEITDNQFCCGGFNLDYAFSSGVRAADSIAKKEKYDKN